MDREHEDQRKKLWCDTFVAVAGASNSVHRSSCKSWADFALEEFDKKFPKNFTE